MQPDASTLLVSEVDDGAGAMGSDPDGPTTYRVILVIMVGLLMVGLVTIGLLGDDRPSRMRSAARPVWVASG